MKKPSRLGTLIFAAVAIWGMSSAAFAQNTEALVTKANQALAQGLPNEALRLLNGQAATNNPVLRDRMTLARARAHFELGQLDQAVKEYSKIEMGSDFWVVAMEERAHTKGRMGLYHEVIADLTSLQSPLFMTTRGPESYFIEALSYLRTCQYRKITETIDQYKQAVRPRVQALSQLSKSGTSKALEEAVGQIKQKGPSTVSYLKVAGQLPERFHLDQTIKNELTTKKGRLTGALRSRVKDMAKQDLGEIQTTTKKLHFIEAEMLQRVSKLAKADGDRGQIGEIRAGKNQLQFPYNGESWIDEVGHYKAEIEGCPEQGVKK